jgi:hypothetical protein
VSPPYAPESPPYAPESNSEVSSSILDIPKEPEEKKEELKTNEELNTLSEKKVIELPSEDVSETTNVSDVKKIKI